MSKILICIPAFNEEDSVGAVIAEVGGASRDWHVLVVDDGSADRTVEVAKAAGAEVVSAPFNLGVGGAMRIGFRFAQDHGYDAMVQIDADGQHDPAEVAAMLKALPRGPEPATVSGARFAGQGDYQVPVARRMAMRLLAASLSRMAKTKLTDVTSGFRAHNRAAIELFARAYPTDYLADTVESISLLTRAGGTVVQVPAVMRPRLNGQPSQSAWKASVYLARILIVLGLTLIRRPGPNDVRGVEK
jgi:glycosyltransferase involved in cell wall biosynthesis